MKVVKNDRVVKLEIGQHQEGRNKRKRLLVKGMMFSTFVLGSLLLGNGQSVQANEWQANSPEAIRMTLEANQSSYTFKEGDTFYNIGIAVNVKWQTLMTANNFELGSQYSVPVGTTISFDGSKMTVTDSAGKVLSETNLKPEDKVDSNQTFAGQKSDTPSKTVSSVNGKNAANLAQKKQELEAEKAQKDKQKEDLEAQKAAAEKELTEKLNSENSSSLASVKEKSLQLEAAVQKQKEIVAQKQSELINAQNRVAEAKVTRENAAANLANAQAKVAEVSVNISKVEETQAKVSAIQSQIAALQKNTTDAEAAKQIAALEQQLFEAQEKLAEYRTTIDRADYELKTAQSVFDASEEGLEQVEAYYNSVQTDLQQRQAELADLQTALSEANKTFPDSAQASNSKEAQKIKEILAEYNKKIEELNKEIADLDTSMNLLDEQIKEIDEALKNDNEYYNNVTEYSGNVIGYFDANDATAIVGQSDGLVGSASSALPGFVTSPKNVNIFVVKNVDQNGNDLPDTLGYIKIYEETTVSVKTSENGETVTTYTTILKWQKV